MTCRRIDTPGIEGWVCSRSSRDVSIESLPSKWLESARTTNDKSSPSHLVDCAEELTAKLRGET